MSEERQLKFYNDLMATVGLDPKVAAGRCLIKSPKPLSRPGQSRAPPQEYQSKPD